MDKWYADYLKSDEYQLRRLRRMLMAEDCNFPQGLKCEYLDCGLFVPLGYINVHHLTYDNIGNEPPEDLAVYCRPCHAFSHGFPRAVWWDAAKKQGLVHLTKQFIAHHSRIKKIGEVMFECLEFAPKAKFALTLHGLRKSLEADALKYPPAMAR